MILASFLAALGFFLIVGMSSFVRSRGTTADYYLASGVVHPALVGVSAFATNNSGYMFIGVIGFTYTSGLAATWLMVGWIVGDLLGSLAVHRQLKLRALQSGELSFGGLLACWGGREHRTVRILGAVLTIVFLGAYAAAQLSAGGKALQSIFGWNAHTGAVLVALIVVLYCLAGGLRASIWTDLAQAAVMLLAMGVLLWAAVDGLGGLGASLDRLRAIPGHMNWFPDDLLIPGFSGAALFAVGWLFAGLSAIGQPHLMIRFMALDDPERLAHARIWYYTLFAIFYAMATGVGLLARVYLPELASLDPELALPTMALQLLPALVVGVVLAGIFAATMSTADSLVLSCSASFTHDLAPRSTRSLWISKAVTLTVTAFALAISIAGPSSVFTLVILSWSTLASVFAPLVVVYARGGRPSQALAVTMMILSPLVALLWRYFGLHEHIYEGMPGILTGLLVYYVGARLGSAPADENAALHGAANKLASDQRSESKVC